MTSLIQYAANMVSSPLPDLLSGDAERHEAANTGSFMIVISPGREATGSPLRAVDPLGISDMRQESADEDARRVMGWAAKETAMKQALAVLRAAGVKFGELLLYISDPSFKQGEIRWRELFGVKNLVKNTLDHWMSSQNSSTGRQVVHNWAVSMHKTVDPSFALDFSLIETYNSVCLHCPATVTLLHALATTTRQKKKLANSVPPVF